MTSRTKKIMGVVIAIVIAIQFVQPARNNSGQVLPEDISKIYPIPGNVQSILKTACYDCHSNNTRYPWYSFIQPAAWLLSSHIKNGKAELNFSEFGAYSDRRKTSKLKSIENSVRDATMPLPTYTFIHKNARLSEQDRVLLENWARNTRENLISKN